MSPSIDEPLKLWGETCYYRPVAGRKGRNIRGGRNAIIQQTTSNTSSLYAVFKRTVHRRPEVIVKIAGGGKNMAQIATNLEYLSRQGSVEVEDEQGERYLGMEAMGSLRAAWAKGYIGIPETGERRREAFHIILSMPEGTHRASVTNAARAFAQHQFKSHQYVLAPHDDEPHPHVHIAVKATNRYGRRLNPRKGDLQAWRMHFAEKLREQGIEANATPRRARGVLRYAHKQILNHLSQPSSSLSNASEITINKTLDDLTLSVSSAYRQKVHYAYGQVARALVIGMNVDKALALQTVRFVEQMPVTVSLSQHYPKHAQGMKPLMPQKSLDSTLERISDEIIR